LAYENRDNLYEKNEFERGNVFYSFNGLFGLNDEKYIRDEI